LFDDTGTLTGLTEDRGEGVKEGVREGKSGTEEEEKMIYSCGINTARFSVTWRLIVSKKRVKETGKRGRSTQCLQKRGGGVGGPILQETGTYRNSQGHILHVGAAGDRGLSGGKTTPTNTESLPVNRYF